MPPVNRLATETSPYLRQHADNPVDWYPWGPEAFAVARETDRPVLLSVGYSACHWCHVMAHESFEDPETAALMNRLFVNVKVDREERPDVDAIYMEATQAMTGSGGWPMTVFMDADGAPFYCGTYFPRTGRGGMPSFTQLCAAIDDAWRHKREGLAEQAQHLTEYLRRQPKFNTDAEPVGVEALGQGEEQLLRQHDTRWGGFGGAPKFPQSMSVDLLLHQALRTGSTEALAAATRSLDAMCAGGMYDHLGGGFARYSVDEQWLVPHFEKMLYDNALLLRPYLHAWQMTGNAAYRRVVDETITYLLRDLRHPDGGFFSAEDADSLDAHGHSEEGAFYVWSLDELHDVVAADLMAEARPQHGMIAIGRRQADDADRHAHFLLHQVGLDGERPVGHGLKQRKRRCFRHQFDTRGLALVGVDERAVEIGDHGKETLQLRPRFHLRHLMAVLVDGAIERLKHKRAILRRPFAALHLLALPIQELREAIDLVVVTTVWKLKQLGAKFIEPRRRLRQQHLSLFDHRGHGQQPGLLVFVNTD